MVISLAEWYLEAKIISQRCVLDTIRHYSLGTSYKNIVRDEILRHANACIFNLKGDIRHAADMATRIVALISEEFHPHHAARSILEGITHYRHSQ